MSPYALLGSRVGTAQATQLSARLTAWHDAMVAHERRLRTGRTTDACNDECPHVEARALWAEAVETLGPQAGELTFLRSRAIVGSPSLHDVVTTPTVGPLPAESAARTNRRRSVPRPGPLVMPAPRSRAAQGEREA